MEKRAYKYRLYPTPEQAHILSRTFGCCRYVWNWALRLKSDAWMNDQRRVGYHDLSAELTKLKAQTETVWLNEVSSVPLQQSLRNLDRAYQNFFEGRARYPRFKSKHSHQSATYVSTAFSWKNGQLALAKMTEPLNVRWSRRFKGKPSTVTISKDPADQYFVSFLVEESIKCLPVSKKMIGVDLGLLDTVATSEGSKFGNPRFFQKQ